MLGALPVSKLNGEVLDKQRHGELKVHCYTFGGLGSTAECIQTFRQELARLGSRGHSSARWASRSAWNLAPPVVQVKDRTGIVAAVGSVPGEHAANMVSTPRP